MRPSSHIPKLEIWGYYLNEELAHGPPYDLEIVQMDYLQDDETEPNEVGMKSLRKTVIAGYYLFIYLFRFILRLTILP